MKLPPKLINLKAQESRQIKEEYNMKYLFIFVILWAILKVFVFKNLKRKAAFLILSGIAVLAGLAAAWDISLTDFFQGGF